jgi:hypothetical protein
VLHDNSNARSLYWTRSSADGRYVASGLQEGDDSAQIVDLQRGKTIAVKAMYDPGFFADNSGFVFQGNNQDGDGLACEQSVLASGPQRLTGSEPACMRFNEDDIGLYQQVARAVEGGDYWAAAGAFESDDGGFEPTLGNPMASFDEDSSITLTPLVNQGDHFTLAKATEIQTPHEGDPVLSPSGTLLINRVKGKEMQVEDPDSPGDFIFVSEQSGYTIHALTTQHAAQGLSASLKNIGRICLEGGKPVLSMDERWMVIHHYVEAADASELGFSSANDAAFAPYLSKGAANLYLVDLQTAVATRLTDMGPGEYALFPHFRSDGWIYFVVRTLDEKEYFAASDAALVLEAR